MIQGSPKATIPGTQQRYSPPVRTPLSIYWRNAAQPLLLISIDAAFLGASIVLSWLSSSLWADLLHIEVWPLQHQAGIYLAFGLFSLTFLAVAGSYEPSRRGSLARDCVRVIGVGSFVAMVLGLATLPLARSHYGLVLGVLVWANATFFLLMAKVVARQLMEVLWQRGVWCRWLIIVGNSAGAHYAAQELGERGDWYRVLGLVELDDGSEDSDRHNGIPCLGSVNALTEVVEAHSPCEVLICATATQYASVGESIHALIPPRTPVSLALSPLMGGMMLYGADSLNGTFPIVRVKTGRLSWQYERLKRLLDIVLSALVLLAIAPVMAVIALAIKLESPGPILFRQIRIGRQGRPFSMYKFRSMRADAEALLNELAQQNEATGPMFKMRSDPRITRVGRIIRRLSLDELPQLFNVLEGNMSLVGPRPPLPNEVEQYLPIHFRRLEAVPGMTGLWQVTRGAEISFDEMVQQDLEYIDHWTLLLDLKILFKTVPAVVSAKGSY